MPLNQEFFIKLVGLLKRHLLETILAASLFGIATLLYLLIDTTAYFNGIIEKQHADFMASQRACDIRIKNAVEEAGATLRQQDTFYQALIYKLLHEDKK